MSLHPELKKEIDVAFLKEVVAQLRSNTLTPQTASAKAQEFLPVVQAQEMDSFVHNVQQFVTDNPPFAKLLIILENFHHDQKTRDILNQMRVHMQNGEIDSAISVAQQMNGS
ncbi:MAG: hypothetical protein ACOCXQ_04920 [Patescibacteria group bacterium]